MMKKVGVFLTIVCIAGMAQAGTIATPYVTGDFDGWANVIPMTETGVGTDIWTYNITGMAASSRTEFKITDGTWGTTVPGGNNSWVYSDGAGNVTVSYDGNTYADGWSTTLDRIGVSTDGGAWTAVGDWQSQVGGADWDNANMSTAMLPLGGGIYEITAVLAPGSYNWKAVAAGSWDAISWDERSVNAANWGFTTDAVNDTAIMTVDALTGVAKIDVIPEPATITLALLGGIALLWRRRR